MLDAFIIDELRRKEKAERAHNDNRLHLPVPEGSDRRPQPSDRRPAADGFEMPSQPAGEAIVIDMLASRS